MPAVVGRPNPVLVASLLVLGLALAHLPAAGQSAAPVLTSSIGTATVEGWQLYRMSVRPELEAGPWAVALDLELYLDRHGGLTDRGWQFGNRTQAVDSFLRKLYYLRYQHPEDSLYIRVGALDNITLGYGLVVDNYRNTLQYPGIKKAGLYFGRRGIAGTSLGLEGMVNSLQDLEQGGLLVGLRAYGRTLGRLEVGLTGVADLDQYSGLADRDGDGYPDAIDAFPDDQGRARDNDRDGIADPLDCDDDNDGVVDVDPGSGLRPSLIDALVSLSNSFGAGQFPVDLDVARQQLFSRDRVGADRFAIVAADAAWPLLLAPAVELKTYAQAACLIDDDDALTPGQAAAQGVEEGNSRASGWGLAAPGVWLRSGPLRGRLEYRYFHDQFDSGYFDNLYEVDRARLDTATGRARSKDSQLARRDDVAGLFGEAFAAPGGFVEAGGSYQYLTGRDDPKQQLKASLEARPRLLDATRRLRAARAYYQKNNIGTRPNRAGTGDEGFFEPTEDTLYGYAFELEMATDVTVLWDTRYTFTRGADQRLRRRRLLTIETVFGLR